MAGTITQVGSMVVISISANHKEAFPANRYRVVLNDNQCHIMDGTNIIRSLSPNFYGEDTASDLFDTLVGFFGNPEKPAV